MTETATRSHWSDGISLEDVPIHEQPRVIVRVQCFRENPAFPNYATPLPVEICDLTDWLQSNFSEQLRILDQIESSLPEGSTDLDDLGDPDRLDDGSSGDHLVGLDDPKLPTGDAGTDIHLVSGYVKYLLACRDRGFIPFSDVSGHLERTRDARHRALNEAHAGILSAVDRYTALAQENASAVEHEASAGSEPTKDQLELLDRAQTLLMSTGSVQGGAS